MKIRAIIGALIGAVAGALLWGGIVYLAHVQIGWVAWLIGVMVGGGAYIMKGRGATMGSICAILALAAIFVGKMLGLQFYIDAKIKELVDEEITQQSYQEVLKDAKDFAQLTSYTQYKEFMAKHDYSESSNPEEVSAEEMTDFTNETIPELKQMVKNPPPYEKWKETQRQKILTTVSRKVSLANTVAEHLGIFDLIFALLGLSSAFKLGSGSED